MVCSYCGKTVEDSNIFCIYCGKRIGNKNDGTISGEIIHNQPERANQVRHIKTIYFTSIAIAIVVMLLIAGAVCYIQLYPKYSYSKNISLGDKYFSEMNYDEAILAYETAIEIDPANVSTYLKLADVYLAMTEANDSAEALEYFEKAIGVLQDAIENVEKLSDKRDLEKKINQIRESAGYKNVRNKNGEGEKVDEIESVQEISSKVTGLYYTGAVNYHLNYHMNKDNSTEIWSMTYPDDLRVLIGANKHDYDHDGEDEVLSIVLERDPNTEYGYLRLIMIENINGVWHIVSDIRALTGLYELYTGRGRFDVFYKEESGQTIVYIEEIDIATAFADGISYSLFSYTYDGNAIKEYSPKVFASGSDDPVSNWISSMEDIETYSYYVHDEYEEIQNFVREINDIGQFPSRLGLNYPISESSTNNVLLTHIIREDDSDTWEYNPDSAYGYYTDAEGNLGNIIIEISDYSDGDKKMLLNKKQ